MTEAPASVTVTAAATPAALDLVQDRLADLWRSSPGVSARDRARFEMGLVEMVANVVEHAYRRDDSGAAGSGARELSVRITVTDDSLEAELGDNGMPVEIDLSDVTLPDPDAESGRGLALALASLDHLEHRRDGGRNVWVLRCVRGRDA